MKGWQMCGGAVTIDDGAVIPGVVTAMSDAGLVVVNEPEYRVEQARAGRRRTAEGETIH